MLMLIPREEYLNRLIALKDKQIIKVVTGVRRCGKSKLLELYQQWLLAQGVEVQGVGGDELVGRSILRIWILKR